ncbi:hypothetical protein DFJ64_1707 [Thermasporomyces composti]|uniref:Helix-hairpin-helix domain-containing protein n=1 Tax=Thermasporomyces composti TaxID=696763 RepID=A0A3D9VG69_THECX|nr:hypothetical protein DFJ64_1707 [Thermasporomyces composti]
MSRPPAPTSSGGGVPTERRAERGRPWYRDPGSLWALVPLVSAGLFAWVPALYAWVKLRERELLRSTVGLAVLSGLAFVLVSLDPSMDDPSAEPGLAGSIGVVLALVAMGAGTVQAFRLRSRVFGVGGEAIDHTPSRAAIAQVQYARARRAEARAIVERDPAMARELRIGRPDVSGRTYDDGGLVDLNHVGPEVMVHVLELSPEHAEEIVRVRAEIHGFASLEELSAYTSLPPPVVEGLRERAIFLRY